MLKMMDKEDFKKNINQHRLQKDDAKRVTNKSMVQWIIKWGYVENTGFDGNDDKSSESLHMFRLKFFEAKIIHSSALEESQTNT